MLTSPPARTPTRRLLRLTDVGADELGAMLDTADALEQHGHEPRLAVGGDLLACVVEGRATATRAALAGAAHRLGLGTLFLTSADARAGEALADTLHALSASAAAIALHLPSQTSIDAAAPAATVPVLNAGSAEQDPPHALADLLTLREHFGSLAGLRIAYLGADRALPASLGEAAELLGMELLDAAPPTPVSHPDPYGRLPRQEPARLDPREAVRGAHVLYTDAWVSGGDQARRGGGIWDAAAHQVTEQLLALADPEAVVLHRLPIHRGQEIAGDIADGPRSLIWRQAAKLLPATAAALLHLLEQPRAA